MLLMGLCQSQHNDQIPRKEEENMSVENWGLCVFSFNIKRYVKKASPAVIETVMNKVFLQIALMYNL
jgi:dsRNA-specific ribonuclease